MARESTHQTGEREEAQRGIQSHPGDTDEEHHRRAGEGLVQHVVLGRSMLVGLTGQFATSHSAEAGPSVRLRVDEVDQEVDKRPLWG